MRDLRLQIRDYFDESGDPVSIEDVFFANAGDEKVRPIETLRPTRRFDRRGLLAAAAAFVVVLVVGTVMVLVDGPPTPTTQPPATTVNPTTVTTTTAAITTTTTGPAPSTTAVATTPIDLEAVALDAIAGAGTMLVQQRSGWVTDQAPGIDYVIFGWLEPPDLLSAVERDIYLDLAPRPETRLQDGAVWLAAFPDASQAMLFLAQVTDAYRVTEEQSPSPISEFDVPAIDGARGTLARWMTGRGGPSSSPNATIWFQVGAVVAAVDVNFGGDFADDEWPIESAVHLAEWVRSSLSAQASGQQMSGPEAPVPPPPSEVELAGVALLEQFYEAIVAGDMDAAWPLVGIERPGAGCGEICQSQNFDMSVRAPELSAMLEPFGATAGLIGCSATATSRMQIYPGDDGFRDTVDVRCLFQIVGDPWLEALGISNLIEADGSMVPGELIVLLPSIPEHPGVESVDYQLLMFARHAGGADADTLASACIFDPSNPDEEDAWSVDTELPFRHRLERTCSTYSGDFGDVVIPSVP